jgi:hypothetical protein
MAHHRCRTGVLRFGDPQMEISCPSYLARHAIGGHGDHERE